MIDKKKVDSLLLIPPSPLVVEDFFMKTKDEKLSVFFVCFLFFEKEEKLFATLVIFLIFLVKMELWKIGR